MDIKLVLANAMTKEFIFSKMVDLIHQWVQAKESGNEASEKLLFNEIASACEVVVIKDIIDQKGIEFLEKNLKQVEVGHQMIKRLEDDRN